MKEETLLKTEKNEYQKLQLFELLIILPCSPFWGGGGIVTIVLVLSRKYLKFFIPVCVAFKIVVNNLISNKQEWNRSHWKSIISLVKIIISLILNACILENLPQNLMHYVSPMTDTISFQKEHTVYELILEMNNASIIEPTRKQETSSLKIQQITPQHSILVPRALSPTRENINLNFSRQKINFN